MFDFQIWVEQPGRISHLWFVAKSPLGRGLGNLLHPPANGSGAKTPAPTLLHSPGSDSLTGLPLLLGGNATGKKPFTGPPASARPAETASKRGVAWGYFVADLVLSGQAALIVYRRTAPLQWWEAGLCSLAVGLGCWLSCQAFGGGQAGDPSA